MSESKVRNALSVLAREAVNSIKELGEEFESYHGRIPLYNTKYDEQITNLPSFPKASGTLDTLALVRKRYGAESRRLAVQFIYQFFNNLEQPIFNSKTFEATWSLFWNELTTPTWTYIAVANLQNFRSESSLIDLGDGITIRHRAYDELGKILGWNERTLDYTLGQDWSQGAYGEHVLLVENKILKSPENFVLDGDPTLMEKARRALLAMRLQKPGDVRIGRIFYSRPAEIKVLGGITSSGFTVWHHGPEYRLEASEADSMRTLCDNLVLFETKYGQKLRNLALALRSFSSIYDRYLHQAEDRVVDAITAMEALLKIERELSFRLAFRVAGTLEGEDDKRTGLFDKMVDYYEARNKIVHGSSLEKKHLEIIRNDEPLRNILRRLLLAFLHLIKSQTHYPTKKFYQELDSMLQSSQRRAELRREMGFM